MPECIKCEAYTRFRGGLCSRCYKKDVNAKNTTPKTKESKNNNTTGNPWVSGVIKGRIAETIAEELFRSLGFEVFSYGMENSVPGIKDHLKNSRDNVAVNIRQMPDFVVFKDKKAHFIEVKYRASGELKLSDIEKYGRYSFEDTLFVLITKKHIKCISYQELKKDKKITARCKNFLGSRKEFETDKEQIKDYCKYAIKFFENVD